MYLIRSGSALEGGLDVPRSWAGGGGAIGGSGPGPSATALQAVARALVRDQAAALLEAARQMPGLE